MKKTLLLTLLGLIIFNLSAQTPKPEAPVVPATTSKPFNGVSLPYSIAIGYGNMGVNLKVDMAFMMYNQDKSSTRFYIDANYLPLSFTQSQLRFNSVNYPSDVFLLSLGGGFAQEFVFDRFTVSPLLGARYYYVRFTDKSLVDAIGTYNLIRYSDQTQTRQVGPVVNNAYGNTFGFEVGTKVGIRLTQWLELCGTATFIPFEFSTAGTLFGKYWGEAPAPNPYYVDRMPLKLEGGVRFNFGH